MFICKEGDIVIEVINSKRVHRWNGTAAGVAAAFSFMNSKGILKEIWSFTRQLFIMAAGMILSHLSGAAVPFW